MDEKVVVSINNEQISGLRSDKRGNGET